MLQEEEKEKGKKNPPTPLFPIFFFPSSDNGNIHKASLLFFALLFVGIKGELTIK